MLSRRWLLHLKSPRFGQINDCSLVILDESCFRPISESYKKGKKCVLRPSPNVVFSMTSRELQKLSEESIKLGGKVVLGWDFGNSFIPWHSVVQV